MLPLRSYLPGTSGNPRSVLEKETFPKRSSREDRFASIANTFRKRFELAHAKSICALFGTNLRIAVANFACTWKLPTWIFARDEYVEAVSVLRIHACSNSCHI